MTLNTDGVHKTTERKIQSTCIVRVLAYKI